MVIDERLAVSLHEVPARTLVVVRCVACGEVVAVGFDRDAAVARGRFLLDVSSGHAGCFR